MESKGASHAFLICSTIFITAAVQSAPAEESKDSVAERRWSITLSLTVSSQGPESDIEDALTVSGFNQTSPAGFFGSATSHPFSRAGSGLPWMVSCRYEFSTPFQLGLTLGSGSNGQSHGYRDPLLYLTLNYSAFVFAPGVYVHHDGFRLGIAPSIFIIKTWLDDAHTNSTTQLGVLVDAGVSIPAFSRFYFDIDVQNSFVPTSEIGPFTAEHVNDSATLPRSRVNFSHYLIAIGGGIRL